MRDAAAEASAPRRALTPVEELAITAQLCANTCSGYAEIPAIALLCPTVADGLRKMSAMLSETAAPCLHR